ncbi:hypothetical protein [Pseudooceanicola aestuarii]|uniref:hypothetical protein n=1 Tax=Pseudooceanicola aestuarii TaxID=2697319 RepID=UPI0013D55013|nr:hypothetical protein [Pseudooceanicola aestuarii]
MSRSAMSLALILVLTSPLAADEVSDTLRSALEAYEEGDLSYALEELDFARQKMMTMKADSLGGFLPPAPEGWTRTVNTEMSAAMGMMGGGVGAEATYADPDGTEITLSIMADNPMVGAMSGMLANAGMMGMQVERVGRQKFAIQDNTVQGLIDNRILVKGEGEADAVLDLLGQMDFRELGRFGT